MRTWRSNGQELWLDTEPGRDPSTGEHVERWLLHLPPPEGEFDVRYRRELAIMSHVRAILELGMLLEVRDELIAVITPCRLPNPNAERERVIEYARMLSPRPHRS